MDTNILRPPNMQRPPFPPAMGQGFPQIPSPAPFMPQYLHGPFGNPAQAFQKASQFARGVYITGFETSLTAQMLEKQFRIKPIVALKLPLTKFNDNKGFAFVYYESPDDAAYVKEKLDHTVILQNKIRVAKTVNADNLSKMMFKLKTNGLTPDQIKDIKEKHFNEKNLQAQVAKIINPLFINSVELNKIIIPRSKIDKSALNYARGFFYISNPKEASRIVKMQSNQVAENNPRKDYDVVLTFIAEKLNSDPELSKYVKVEVYQYAIAKNPNVLHIRNIKLHPNQDRQKITQELQAWVQAEIKQIKIKSCYVGIFRPDAVWANVGFENSDEAQAAYKHFKNNHNPFRGVQIFATLKNYQDPRVLAISAVRKQVTGDEIKAFLSKLVTRSQRVDPNDQTKGRKYDYHSFNFIEETTYYYRGSELPSVGLKEGQEPKESWIKMNTVPRRVVLRFLNDIQDNDAYQLSLDIKLTEGWEKIFFEKDKRDQIKSGHHKGHVQNGVYVWHFKFNQKKKGLQITREPKPKMPRDMNQNRREGGQFVFNKNQRPGGGIPRSFPGNQNRDGSFKPPIRQGQMPPRPMGQMGPMPAMGSMMNPKMGTIPIPVMGGMQVPQMGKPGGGMPPLGGFPQMGGMPPMPPMGLPPQMGTGLPTMGSGVPPPMGAPKMGGNMPFGAPPSTQKKL